MDALRDPGPLPLVGRTAELAELHAALDAAARGTGSSWLVSGPGGIGKTRLGRALIEETERRGWSAASGRAFPAEAGVPYALFADALLPIVRRMAEAELLVLTRGVSELTQIFPWLGGVPAEAAALQAPDFRSRLHWHFTQFLRALSAKQPLVVVLEDLQWADTSSLELLHYVARHLTDAPLVLYCTYNPEKVRGGTLRALEQTVSELPRSRMLQLEPLPVAAVEEMVCRAFDVDARISRGFSALLYGWTRGNPFFIEETLKLLIAAGDLRLEDRRWTGWQIDALRLPPSVRDAITSRLENLSPAAREAAELAAIFGGRFRLESAAAVLRVEPHMLLAALDELRRERVIDETDAGGDLTYEFSHPLIRETLYDGLSRARARLLHSAVAATLEEHYGAAALDHADELAYHFGQAPMTDATDASPKAVLYLAEAGRRALAKYANREAADYLAAALERVLPDSPTALEVTAELARARQRLGEYAAALALWERVRDGALAAGDPAGAAAISRRMGLACYWSGDVECALRHFDDGLAQALAAADMPLAVRLYTVKAACLQEVGQPREALATAHAALLAAEEVSDPAVHARVHRTFLQLHLWLGDADLAHHHGARALELAEHSNDRPLAFTAHWAMGVLHAFGGDAVAVEKHLRACHAIADDLRAPVLRVWAAELAVEFASARGDWDQALQIGEEAIGVARALHQRTLLPRLLVWTALIHLGRSDSARAAAYIDEAWQMSGAAQGTGGGVNVHAVLPAYIGRAALALARCDYLEAARIAEEGVAIADRTGYTLWAVHRLLPILVESHLWLRNLEEARSAGARLGRDAARLGHRLGEAWSSACDALIIWLEGDSERGAVLLRSAAEQLEALPFIPDATRLRRQLAGRLADIGQREAALCELRLVHERLLQLGAEEELSKARQQFRELGTRPPPRGRSGRSGGAITQREKVIAALVAERRSSKAIARELLISVRTVDAHLSNIYRKLSIGSREELSDRVRAGTLSED
jgi:DNA-binding CsgD family transcriptional regulator/tetratricopeptide (TPR) repeat protein